MTFLRKLTVMTALAFSLLLGQVMPSQALTPQQELIDKSRISFEKLIGSYEFGELPGYLKRAKAVMIMQDDSVVTLRERDRPEDLLDPAERALLI